MLSSLADPILPIFAVLALGYGIARAGLMEAAHAQAINRFTFYVATPALVASVIGQSDPAAIAWGPALVYLGAELTIYAIVFALMRFAFGRSPGEALLLGMTAIFANHIFFVLPIAEPFYPGAAAAMAGNMLFDAAVIFCGTVLLTEFLTGDGNLRKTRRSLARNPFIYAPIAGLVIGALGPAVPSGIWTFLGFTSAAAAPVTLFAIGITLAAAPIFPIRLPCWTVTVAKLAVVPALVWAGIAQLPAAADPLPATITLLIAAGPCGAMPFVIATQYGVRTGTIAKTILVSTVLSLVSLAVLLP